MNDDKSPMPVSMGLSSAPMIERRDTWAVIIRVNVKASWCGYGPMTHQEALEFDRKTIGTGIEHQPINLIPLSATQRKRFTPGQ